MFFRKKKILKRFCDYIKENDSEVMIYPGNIADTHITGYSFLNMCLFRYDNTYYVQDTKNNQISYNLELKYQDKIDYIELSENVIKTLYYILENIILTRQAEKQARISRSDLERGL